jgi:hypothetical protein
VYVARVASSPPFLPCLLTEVPGCCSASIHAEDHIPPALPSSAPAGIDPEKGIRIEAIAADVAVTGLSIFAAALNAAVDAAIKGTRRKDSK